MFWTCISPRENFSYVQIIEKLSYFSVSYLMPEAARSARNKKSAPGYLYACTRFTHRGYATNGEAISFYSKLRTHVQRYCCCSRLSSFLGWNFDPLAKILDSLVICLKFRRKCWFISNNELSGSSLSLFDNVFFDIFISITGSRLSSSLQNLNYF